MAIGLAFKAFFLVLFRKEAADAVRQALARLDTSAASAGAIPVAPKSAAATPAAQATALQPPAAAAVKTTGRSDALTLLGTLQREARFLDLVGEPLEGFEDAQVGAAARQVLSDVRKSLDRMFAVAPIAGEDEGSSVSIPKPASPVRYHVIGRNADQATRGTLVHRGWKAGRCQTPSWNGASDDAFVLSPVEIEVDG